MRCWVVSWIWCKLGSLFSSSRLTSYFLTVKSLKHNGLVFTHGVIYFFFESIRFYFSHIVLNIVWNLFSHFSYCQYPWLFSFDPLLYQLKMTLFFQISKARCQNYHHQSKNCLLLKLFHIRTAFWYYFLSKRQNVFLSYVIFCHILSNS